MAKVGDAIPRSELPNSRTRRLPAHIHLLEFVERRPAFPHKRENPTSPAMRSELFPPVACITRHVVGERTIAPLLLAESVPLPPTHTHPPTAATPKDTNRGNGEALVQKYITNPSRVS